MTLALRRRIRRLRYGKAVVVVSGLPRSGTSMAMRMLETGGVPLVVDGLRTADEDNPRGYFEDERVKNLSQMGDKSWLRAARGRALKVISYLLRDLPPNNNYKVIFMHRDLQEVLASQAKMLIRRQQGSEIPDEKMVEIWESHLWRIGYLFRRSPHLERLDVHYAAAIADPRREAERINAFLGLSLDVDRIATAVDERLYRNRSASHSPPACGSPSRTSSSRQT